MFHTKKWVLLSSLLAALTIVIAACGAPATGTDTTASTTSSAAASTAAASTAAASTEAASAAASSEAASTGASAAAGGADKFAAAKGCKNVGVMLPETDSSARWESQDRPLLDSSIKAALPGATIDYVNANNNADTQQNQAETLLTKGVCILVVGAKDSVKASAIVQRALASKVPVIAYDRLIQDNDLAFYVSFDNVKVGELQGQYIVDNAKQGDNVAMINGSQTDNNAILFKQGAMNKLKPLFDSGKLKLVYDTFTPDWNNATAQSEMEGALTQNNNNIQIAYVANDGMANTAIAALKAQQLNGKVLVTGQDATVAGIQNILTGDQGMTVYKAIALEAKAAADLVAALSNGTSTDSLVNGKTKTSGGADIPSVLAVPVAVTKANVKDTVIKDGFVKIEDVCKGLPAGAGGVCP